MILILHIVDITAPRLNQTASIVMLSKVPAYEKASNRLVDNLIPINMIKGTELDSYEYIKTIKDGKEYIRVDDIIRTVESTGKILRVKSVENGIEFDVFEVKYFNMPNLPFLNKDK